MEINEHQMKIASVYVNLNPWTLLKCWIAEPLTLLKCWIAEPLDFV